MNNKELKVNQHKKRIGVKIYALVIFIFLYFPLLIVFIFSLSPTPTMWDVSGITGKWYKELFHDRGLLIALLHSFEIGIIAVTIALIFGTFGAFFVTKVVFPGKNIFRILVLLPFVLPGIIMGLTLLIFVKNLNIKLSMHTVLLGHISFTTPIVMFQVVGRLQRMGPNYQLAAQDLGANPLKTFWFITLPMIRTALIGAALLAFTVSFDEIIISYFLTGTWMTLPVYLYGMLRFGMTQKVYAISVLILIMSLSLILLMSRYIGRST